MSDGRTDVPRAGDERELLRAYLDFHRETLALKCAGLADDDLLRRTTPSSLTLLGLVRHMADVERNWFRRALAHEEAPPHYRSAQAPTLAPLTMSIPLMWRRPLPPGARSGRMPEPWSPLSAISTP